MKTFFVISEEKKEAISLSLREFEEKMGIEYLPTLSFQKTSHCQYIEKRCLKAVKNNIFTRKQKWLSHFYEKEILSGYLFKELYLQWIDSRLGYGVFTNCDILPQTFIGEYTGLVRKRKFWENTKNNYCFDYSFGDFFQTPFLIDAEKKGSLMRFVNHSDESNLEPIALLAGGVMHIILISLKKISKGSQLTYDYGTNYWSKRETPLLINSN